jgi:prohead serine protease
MTSFNFAGRAAPFGEKDPIAKPGRPRVEFSPGCFAGAIAQRRTVLKIDHDQKGAPLASQADGSLELQEGAAGLFLCADLDPQTYQRLALERLQGLSVAWHTNAAISYRVPGGHERVVDIGRLIEVSIMITKPPMFTSTRACLVPAFCASCHRSRRFTGFDLDAWTRSGGLPTWCADCRRRGFAA